MRRIVRRRKGRNIKTRRPNKSVQSGGVKLRNNPKFPRDIHMKPIQRRLIRYFVNAAMNTQSVTPESILASMLAVNSVNTNAVSIFDCIRVVRISLYWVPSGNFDIQGNSLTFRWIDQNLPDELFTDRGTLTEPACLKMIPPRNSILSMWYRSNSPTLATPMCQISAPAGSIIDIEFENIILENSSGNPTVYVLTGQPGAYGICYTSILLGKLIPDGAVSTFTTTI